MNSANGHFTKNLENLAADTSDSDDKDFSVLKQRAISIDEFEHFVFERERIFQHEL